MLFPLSMRLLAPRPLAAALAAALLACASALAGPDLACPDGPDPLRFRPEAAVGGSGVAGVTTPVGVAASREPATGAEAVAVTWVTPLDEAAIALSLDGACSFAAPVILSAPGARVAAAPAVAARLEAPGGLVVAWLEGARVVVRETAAWDGTFNAEFDLASDAIAPPLLAAAQGGRALVAAAWLADDAGTALVRVALRDDAGAWGSPADLRLPGSIIEIALACDAAGTSGPGCSVLALLPRGEAHVARLDDPAAGWGAFRRIDDGAAAALSGAALAAGPAGSPESWSVAAWLRDEFAPPGSRRLAADAARISSGAVASDYDGASAAPNPVMATPLVSGRVAAAVAGSLPQVTAFIAVEEASEILLARRPLSDARPRLAGGCGPARVTGLSPARARGTARAPVAAALGDDVVLAFVDDRSGAPEVFVKRSDSAPPAVTISRAAPSGCGAAPRVDLSWTAAPCDAASAVIEVGRAPGATDFTRVVSPFGGASIEGLEPGTTYFFRVRLTDVAGHEASSDERSADTPSCSGALVQAEFVGLTDTCAAGGAGGDGLADPGENVRARIRFRNDGSATATGLRARVLSRSGFVTIRTGPRDLGDLAAGAALEADFDVDVSATAPCGEPLLLLIRSEISGAQWAELLPLQAGATCTPCRVAGCGVTADASASAPVTLCAGATVTLDATRSSVANCAGILVHEWWTGSNLAGTGQALSRQPAASVSYRLVTRCSTDFDCLSEDTVFVTVNPLPTVSIAQDPPPPRCSGEVVTLTATSNDASATFAWSDGSSGPVLAVSSPGTYTATATDANGCRGSRTARVDIHELPPADAGADAIGCGALRIGTPGFPLLDYAWTPAAGLSDPFVAQPLASPAAPTDYLLTVTDPLTGCQSSDVVRVTSTAGPPAPRALRVRRDGAELLLTWESVPGSAGGRAYADASAERAAVANAGSATALALCSGATSCSAIAPVGPLWFLQVVSTCPDGLGEGPN